jgi:uncharacterized repeat protein (TIGR01451 family)
MLTNFTRKVTSLTLAMTLLCSVLQAQTIIRPFTQVYSENLKGALTMFGNGIFHIIDNNTVNLVKMNETGNSANGVGGIGFSQYGNDNQNMQFIDIDGVAATQNSSSADLILPAGSNTIKFARLYWGGKINSAEITAAPDTLRKIKIRKGNSGAYVNAITPATNVDIFAVNVLESIYQSYVDITQFINTNGAGTYTIADIPLTVGAASGGGKYGGWTIVVAYENPTQPFNSVRVYDGYAQVFNSGTPATLNINLTGLNVPNNTLSPEEAVMGTMSWEGDANLGATATNMAGDFIKINNIAVSNTVNPVTNFWNGSISRNGAFVNTKNPNYTNQMGIDIDEVNVGIGYDILPNATDAIVEFGTEADQYFPSIFTFSIRMKDPLVNITKTVTDANANTFVDANEELTYTLSGFNQGQGSSYNTTIVDTLPSNVTYVSNSLEVLNAPGVTAGFKTDATDGDVAMKGINGTKNYVKFYIGIGATGTSGGELPAGSVAGNYTVRFKVKAGAIPGTVINTASITSTSQSGDLFVDEGTAIIGATGGPLPVRLTSFKAILLGNRNTMVKWTTEAEINNDHFEVERSDDGIQFTLRGKVNGKGSTSSTHNYELADLLNTSSPIVYYRLRIIGRDGKFSYSKIVALKMNGTLNTDNFSVYPNPFVNDLKVSINSSTDYNAAFRIISFDGRELMRRMINLQKGDNIVVLNDLGNLPKGSYILEVTTEGNKYVKRIIKN